MKYSLQTSTSDWIRFKNAVVCNLVGHDVDNTEPRERCMCGERIFREDGTPTKIRSNISCFLFFHSYERMARRDAHNEYVCVYCGHTLLFRVDHDPFKEGSRFDKKVAYRCNLRGHHVHQVVERDGYFEYACTSCGHPFLRREDGLTFITHLPKTILGHAVVFVARRNGYAEFLCADSGHPFCILVDPSQTLVALESIGKRALLSNLR
jgi:DNA-directed RNA polymerase subunit RPC12/RpoP